MEFTGVLWTLSQPSPAFLTCTSRILPEMESTRGSTFEILAVNAAAMDATTATINAASILVTQTEHQTSTT